MGLGIAQFANNVGPRAEKVYKSIIFMPMAISFVSAATIWRLIYAYLPEGQKQVGLLNAVWVALGGSPQTWLQIEAIEFWKRISDARNAPQKKIEIIEVVIEKEKKDSVWLRYYEKMMLNREEMKTWSRDKIRRWIVADYLNNCKAPPRTADVNRYSFGLYLLSRKDKLDIDDIGLDTQY